MNVYGLIGYPLGHSFSKAYFTQKFADESLTDCRFELFPLSSIEAFPAFIANNPDLRGFAVTIPHKVSVIPYLTSLDPGAELTGAVNCICVNGSQLTGYNTDVIGFERSFVPLLQPYHTQALVLGTGGASKAVQTVLKKIGMPFLLVTRSTEPKKGNISYAALDQTILREYSVVINCTPVGMTPNEGDAPEIPYHLLNGTHLLYDLIYKPAQTLFLQKGLQQGAMVSNGHEMFLIQAEENWRIWNQR